jgi:hypothetical protein
LLLKELPPGCYANNFTFVFFTRRFIILFLLVGHASASVSYSYTEPSQVLCSLFFFLGNFCHPIASFAIQQLVFLFIFAMFFSLSFSSACQRKSDAIHGSQK